MHKRGKEEGPERKDQAMLRQMVRSGVRAPIPQNEFGAQLRKALDQIAELKSGTSQAPTVDGHDAHTREQSERIAELSTAVEVMAAKINTLEGQLRALVASRLRKQQAKKDAAAATAPAVPRPNIVPAQEPVPAAYGRAAMLEQDDERYESADPFAEDMIDEI